MIIFAHGLEGTPNGSKIQALRASGFEVLAPDFQGMVLSERVALLEKICEQHANKKPILAGSSYGGLTAAIIAMRMPHQFTGLLLCAPALHLKEDPVDAETILVAPNGMPTVIGCTTAANAKSRVKGFTFNTTSKKCTLYKSIRGERKNTSSVSGKKS